MNIHNKKTKTVIPCDHIQKEKLDNSGIIEFNNIESNDREANDIKFKRKAFIIKTYLSDVFYPLFTIILTIITILISIRMNDFVKETTLAMNEFTKDTAHIDYHLTLEKKACYIMMNNALFNIDPFVFNYERANKSGKVKEIYISYFTKKGEGNILKLPKNKQLAYFNSDEILSQPKVNMKKKFKSNQFAFAYASSNLSVNEPMIFHILLKAYNGEFQFFTIVSYFDNEAFDNDSITKRDCSKIQTKIIKDTDIFDIIKMKEIYANFNGKSKEITSYQALQRKIRTERTKIASILNL